MSIQNKSTYTAQKNSDFANNTSGLITPTIQRADRENLKDSVAFLSDANTYTAQQRWAKGADLVSKAALGVDTSGNYFDVTGSATITSMDDSGGAGAIIMLQFDGAAVLTHHATDLILPAGANITAAAGDHAIFCNYASGNYRLVAYQRKDGTALAGSAETYLLVNSGGTAPTAAGTDAISIGELAIASATTAIAIGLGAEAEAVDAISIGNNTGDTSGTKGTSSISIGVNANAGAGNIGTSAIAIGINAVSSGAQRGIAIGGNAINSSSSSVAIGYSTDVTADDAIGIGLNAQATAIGSISVGRESNATAQGAIIMGYHSSAQTNSVSDSFELAWDGTTQFKAGATYGTGITSNADPDTNLTDKVNGVIAYDSTDHEFRAYLNSAWTSLVTASATVYDYLYIDAAAMVPSSTSGAQAGSRELATYDVMVDYLGFATGADEYAQYKWKPPEQIVSNAVIRFKFDMITETGAATTLVFGMQFIIMSNDEALDGVDWSTATVAGAVTMTTTNDIYMSDGACTATLTGIAAGDTVFFRVFRDVSADTHAIDGQLLGVHMQIPVNNTATSVWS
jgi:hypothetical protein